MGVDEGAQILEPIKCKTSSKKSIQFITKLRLEIAFRSGRSQVRFALLKRGLRPRAAHEHAKYYRCRHASAIREFVVADLWEHVL